MLRSVVIQSIGFRELVHYREVSYGLKGGSSRPHWLSLRLDNWCNIRVHLDPGRSTRHTHSFPSSHSSPSILSRHCTIGARYLRKDTEPCPPFTNHQYIYLAALPPKTALPVPPPPSTPLSP